MVRDGADRNRFAREVEARKVELMRRNRDLSAAEAFRLAANEISKENPKLLLAYRMDAESV